MLRFSRNRLVDDRIDFEVRITMRTNRFPMTPTVSTRLKKNRVKNEISEYMLIKPEKYKVCVSNVGRENHDIGGIDT